MKSGADLGSCILFTVVQCMHFTYILYELGKRVSFGLFLLLVFGVVNHPHRRHHSEGRYLL